MPNNSLNLKRIIFVVAAIYVAFIICFYFLAGDQLRLRDSRGNTELPAAEAGTVVLCRGAMVEQMMQVKIQRLNSISVQFGGYYRENSGHITMELWRDEELLMQQSFDASKIQEGTVLTLRAEPPIESVYGVPLMIRIRADSDPESAVTPLMSMTSADDGSVLYLTGESVKGMLCFSAQGTDYIWTGLHYWKIAAAFGLLLALLSIVVWHRFSKGKRSFIINAIIALQKYRFLIRQLVARDFKTKYKRSVLGVVWSFLNPLLMMMVQYFVFSTVFKSDIPHFAAYLIIGTVMFNFFSESCSMSLTSILGNAGLITKVYMPKYIYPLTRTLSSLCLGLGMLLAASMVFFRDTQFLWNVLSIMWMYATPIFYPETILSGRFRVVLQLNPLYYFLKSARMCVLDGISPEPVMYFRCLLIALAMLLVGAIVFYKKQDRFVLYL